MIMQKLLIVGLAVWCCQMRVCTGSELYVIAWGSRDGKMQVATYSLPISEGQTNWSLVKVCPAGRFGIGGLVLGPDQVVRAVGDIPEDLKPPEGLGKVIDIAAGGELGMALREDKTVRIWGDDSRARLLSSQLPTNVVAIAAAREVYFFIDVAGRLHIFGFERRQAADELSNVAAVSPVRAIFAQRRVALKRDGTVVEWRKHGGGIISKPEVSNAVAVAASPVHGLALKQDGMVEAWGAAPTERPRFPKG